MSLTCDGGGLEIRALAVSFSPGMVPILEPERLTMIAAFAPLSCDEAAEGKPGTATRPSGAFLQ